MEKRDIVYGPKSDIKRERAREMRRAMTPAETCLWAQLRNNGCGGLHFRRQQIIDGFIADFFAMLPGSSLKWTAAYIISKQTTI